jgi:anaerobic magnesium-protoporphyrin IX monomethyl ester cyclase
MKILLINPGKTHGEGVAYGEPTFPLVGLAYLAAHLRQHGFDTSVVETVAYRMSNTQVRAWLMRQKPDLVGITAKTFNIRAAYEIASMVKCISTSIPVLLGGPHPSALVEHTLAECPDVDAIVRGEGEETLLEVCRRVAAGHKTAHDRFADVAGLSYSEGRGNVVHNANRRLITDLDSLPFPDYSLYDMRKFGRTYDKFTGRFEAEVAMFASRGCPFRCSFCQPHMGRKWRYRSQQNIVTEIQNHLQRFGIHRFCFNDSTFGVDKRWFHEFCELIRTTGLHRRIHWVFETRADLANVELFEDAVAAGAVMVMFGFESGNDTVLSKNAKGITQADIRGAVAAARKARVPAICGSFILGLPYETRQSLQETLDLISELRLDYLGGNIASIYPGTELWDMADRGEGGIRWLPGCRMNWSAYDRTKALTEVNDLSKADLEAGAARAREIHQQNTSRSSPREYIRKSNAYLWHLLFHDRRKLAFFISFKTKSLLGRYRAPRTTSSSPGDNASANRN